MYLADVEPDFSDKQEEESPEQYVKRMIKFLISKESEKGTAAAVEILLGDMEAMRGELSLEKALKKAITQVS